MNTTAVMSPPRTRRNAITRDHAARSPERWTPPVTELDARGPVPPKPLPALLAALAAIPSGHPQYVRTAAPLPELWRALKRAGVEVRSAPLADGTWRTLLRRTGTAAAR